MTEYHIGERSVLIDEGAEIKALDLLRRLYHEQDGSHNAGRTEEWMQVMDEAQKFLAAPDHIVDVNKMVDGGAERRYRDALEGPFIKSEIDKVAKAFLGDLQDFKTTIRLS
jgi:hypothetical protein